MSAARRHKKHHHEEHENHERWLVSGYDMMTLLFAVFVVLYAISSTNTSKVKALQQSLQEAFSGPVLSGGRAIQQTGDTSAGQRSASANPIPSQTPAEAVKAAMQTHRADLPGPARRRRRGRAARGPGAAGLRGAQAQDRQGRRRRRAHRQGVDHDLRARPEGPPAHRQALLRLGQRRDQRRRAPDARKDRRDHRRRRPSTPSRSKATPTTGRSPRPSSRRTGSCRAPARAPSCSG